MRALIPSALIAVTAASLGLVSCGGTQGPAKPQPGTPAFIWETAQNLVKKGSFLEASDQLDKITGKASEFRDRAEVLQIVLATGLAHGDMDWAEVWEEGSKSAREKHLEFKRTAGSIRVTADQMVMRAAEITHGKAKKLADIDLALTVSLPDISTDLPVEAERVKKGVNLQRSEQEQALAKMQKRGVMQAFALFAGTGKDVDKAREAFGKGDFKMTKDQLFLGLAHQYTDFTDIYTSKKLDRSGQIVMLCGEADDALAQVASNADVKAIQKKIAGIRAKLPKK